MKQRVISATVGIFLLIGVLFFYQTIILNIVLAIVSTLAVYELLLATKYIKNNLMIFLSLIFAFLIPFFKETNLKYVCVFFVFLLFAVMLVGYKTVSISHLGSAFFISVAVSCSFSMLIYFRDKFTENPVVALLYILLCLNSAWISDSGAYFIGVFLGKTKLAPNISPKKTVEGVIGGVISSIVVGLLISLIFSYIFNLSNSGLDVNYFRLLILLPLASLVGVFGDLMASVIKRQSKIKDFGKIMPGHGGVLDRFDSVLFTVPFYYFMQMFFPIVK